MHILLRPLSNATGQTTDSSPVASISFSSIHSTPMMIDTTGPFVFIDGQFMFITCSLQMSLASSLGCKICAFLWAGLEFSQVQRGKNEYETKALCPTNLFLKVSSFSHSSFAALFVQEFRHYPTTRAYLKPNQREMERALSLKCPDIMVRGRYPMALAIKASVWAQSIIVVAICVLQRRRHASKLITMLVVEVVVPYIFLA